ncbi:unnamed protein product [Prunus armeniaca]|uniref:Uncharacterized protein n=1 Tax=Prunus armeniaca TaxID=36596 RepID=A0A6J5TJP6_PRUAR|nr:unnamed protein product [Prunus armeniaca]
MLAKVGCTTTKEQFDRKFGEVDTRKFTLLAKGSYVLIITISSEEQLRDKAVKHLRRINCKEGSHHCIGY